MVSARKLEANRRNAIRSTGPRTQVGKRKVSRNARKHGLSISIAEDPSLSREIDELGRILVPEATGERLALARKLAESHVELIRAAEARADLARLLRAKLDAESTLCERDQVPGQDQEPMEPGRQQLDVAFVNALPELLRLERYVQRAFSRRTRALSALLKT